MNRHWLLHSLSLAILSVSILNLCLAMKLIIVVDESYRGMSVLAPGLIIVSVLMWAGGCWLCAHSRRKTDAPEAGT